MKNKYPIGNRLKNNKDLWRTSRSPWNCVGFYIINFSQQKIRASRVLKYIRYPLPNKSDLIKRINFATIFSKFDMNSRYYQISLEEKDKYRTSFVLPFQHYEWNVMHND